MHPVDGVEYRLSAPVARVVGVYSFDLLVSVFLGNNREKRGKKEKKIKRRTKSFSEQLNRNGMAFSTLKRRINTVFTDLDLSIMDSVPTSSRPMCLGSTSCLSNKRWTT